MGKEKGHFKDPDRFTREHEDLSVWFSDTENARDFIRIYLRDIAVGLKTELEVPVKSQSGFLYGFADACLSYETDQGKREKVLIELKASFSDLGEVLRQVRTYQGYLGAITKTCLLYSEMMYPNVTSGSENELDQLMKASQYFGSQGLFFSAFRDVLLQIQQAKKGLSDQTHPFAALACDVPGGRRSAHLCGVWVLEDDKRWCLPFLVEFDETDSSRKITEMVTDPNLYENKSKFREVVREFGIDFGLDAPMTILEGEISLPCEVDLCWGPDEFGEPRPFIEHVYIKDVKIDLA